MCLRMHWCLVADVKCLCSLSLDVVAEGFCARSTSHASVCQAVENFSLALTCTPCDDRDTVHWYFKSRELLSQPNKTLLLAAKDVTEEAAGCYQCLCDSGVGFKSGLHKLYFTVEVGLPGEHPIS